LREGFCGTSAEPADGIQQHLSASSTEEEEDGPYTDGIKGRVSKWHISIGRVKFKLNRSAKSINHDWVAAGYY
jgi:hypothetical protein